MPTVVARHRPCLVIVRDGWGENPYPEWDHANAVKVARPPVDAALRRDWPFTLIATSGEDVGLPDGTMGNSEVGHQNIGAGRIVFQESVRITRAIRDASFFDNPALGAAIDRCRSRGGRLHVMGLASDAGVHSRLEHLLAVVQLAARRGLRDVFIHSFMDGRDTPPTSGAGFLRRIQAELASIGTGRIATLCGRYWAMDRDNRWPRTQRAYRLLTGEGGAATAGGSADVTLVRDPLAALEHAYAHPPEPSMVGDEFVPPLAVTDDGAAPIGVIRDGDAVVFFNFRGDRPRQLVRAFTLDAFPYRDTDKTGELRDMGFQRGRKLDLAFVTMTEYEAGLPVSVAFPKPPPMADIAGQYLSRLGLRQFRCAETEKYAHVTFFFNDYREAPFDGEQRQLVPSPTVSTYDQKPEMSALEITDLMERRIASGVDDLIILNYANPDMVGHTGSLPAAVKACTVVDACVGRVLEAVRRAGGCAIVTADHGNFEQMIDPETGGPHTAHTTYTVPLYVVGEPFRGKRLRDGGRLADVMPTALEMMALDVPAAMTGRSLLQ